MLMYGYQHRISIFLIDAAEFTSYWLHFWKLFEYTTGEVKNNILLFVSLMLNSFELRCLNYETMIQMEITSKLS